MSSESTQSSRAASLQGECLSYSSKASSNGQESSTKWRDLDLQISNYTMFPDDSPNTLLARDEVSDGDIYLKENARVEEHADSGKASQGPDIGVKKDSSLVELPNGDTWEVVMYGNPGSLRYRMLFLDKIKRKMSPWHDLPLRSNVANGSYLTFVCKTSVGKWIEYETAKGEAFSPIRVKKVHGRPAHYSKNVPWNYGFFPQTWTNSRCEIRGERALRQDGKPMEAIDISSRQTNTGDVYCVKVLGAILVIEEGLQASWKVVTISVEDKLADSLNGLSDLFQYLPEKLEEIQTWLQSKDCVSPREKEFTSGLNGQAADEKLANQIVARAHSSWKLFVDQQRLVESKNGTLNCDDYDRVWQQNTANESPESLPLCEQEQTSALRYESAWIQSTTTEDFDNLNRTSSVNLQEKTSLHRNIPTLIQEAPRRRVWLSFLKRPKQKTKFGSMRIVEEPEKGHVVAVEPLILRKNLHNPVFHTPSPQRGEGRRHSLDEATIRKLAVSPARDLVVSSKSKIGKSVEFKGECDAVTVTAEGTPSVSSADVNVPPQLVAEWEELCALGKDFVPSKSGPTSEGNRSPENGFSGSLELSDPKLLIEDESRTKASLLRLTSHLAKVRNQQVSAEELLEQAVEQTALEGSALKRIDGENSDSTTNASRHSQTRSSRPERQREGA